jgi:hypothetical protein
MIIPPLLGNLDQANFFIYAAADATYFDQHARPLINSVLTNTPDIGVHIHIYDPRPDQLEFCRSRSGISVSHETLDPVQFNKVTARWLKRTEFANDRQRQMYKKGQTLGAEGLNLLVRQTYYACTRFIRLAELVRPGQRCLAIDVDGLVRAPFDHQLGMADFYLYEKPKDGTHLAGALLLNGTEGTHEFIKKYAGQIRLSIEQDDIYWFLDQILLDQLVPYYQKGLLPMSYIDWAMREESAIWSAKGKRKELDIFKQEQRKYL